MTCENGIPCYILNFAERLYGKIALGIILVTLSTLLCVCASACCCHTHMAHGTAVGTYNFGAKSRAEASKGKWPFEPVDAKAILTPPCMFH
jgi:hypothetical protein